MTSSNSGSKWTTQSVKGVLQRRQAGLRGREKESHCCFEHGRLGAKQGVLHCMEAADEKLAWRVVSDHCQ
jgi:hypothetical protein